MRSAILVFFSLFLWYQVALGQSITYTPAVTLVWDAVTTYDNGTPAIITEYIVYYSEKSFQDSTGYWLTPAEAAANRNDIKSLSILGDKSETIVLNLKPQIEYYFRLTAIDSYKRESAFNIDAAGLDTQISTVTGDELIIHIRGLRKKE